MKAKAPDGPPPLVDMAARKAQLEEQRKEEFPRWKARLDEYAGNIRQAALAEFPPEAQTDEARRYSRERGYYLTRKLGLVDYAKGLRLAATGQDRGRPKK